MRRDNRLIAKYTRIKRSLDMSYSTTIISPLSWNHTASYSWGDTGALFESRFCDTGAVRMGTPNRLRLVRSEEDAREGTAQARRPTALRNDHISALAAILHTFDWRAIRPQCNLVCSCAGCTATHQHLARTPSRMFRDKNLHQARPRDNPIINERK